MNAIYSAYRHRSGGFEAVVAGSESTGPAHGKETYGVYMSAMRKVLYSGVFT